MNHTFNGKWITDEEFCNLEPRNVFHRQLDVKTFSEEHANSHVLFRKKFNLDIKPSQATIFITADDYYKLYINGRFVSQGPAPSYHSNYNYNTIDVSAFLKEGENTVVVHTYYQGLINRVWQSGDFRHGLILDLECDGKNVISSDETFLTVRHSGFKALHTVGYKTQYMEHYDSRCREDGFEKEDFDDSYWQRASLSTVCDHTLVQQKTKSLVFEEIKPVFTQLRENTLFVDFGKCYVGYLAVSAKSKNGQEMTLRYGQELNDDGTVRYKLRANCEYIEKWTLSGKEDKLNQFDYKSFRYCELDLPCGTDVYDVSLVARHYPFELALPLKKEYQGNEALEKIYELCVNTQKYGVQDVIQDCCEREKGFYVGDGCYTALTHMLLSGDDSIVRKLIDDGFYSSFITEGLVTCLDCSFMQEIGEYAIMLIHLVLWHYRYTGDIEYLKQNYPKCTALLDVYKNTYEQENGLLNNLDKWCVVEWPANFRDGYDVDIAEGKVCTTSHVVMNAHYIESIKSANKIADIIGEKQYRDVESLKKVFFENFYDYENHRYFDSNETKHSSLISNLFCYGFELVPEKEFDECTLELFRERKISSVSMFTAFVIMMGLVRRDKWDDLKACFEDEGAWKRILREGGTTTFEGWGKDTKWNTSLFHLTMSYGAVFMCETDIKEILK